MSKWKLPGAEVMTYGKLFPKKFRQHPLVLGLWLFLGGFAAGCGAYASFSHEAHLVLEPVRKQAVEPAPAAVYNLACFAG